MEFGDPQSDTLWNTNRLLSDLERKLSIVSNTSSSSNQTQHSQSSSVIVDKNHSGIGKQNIQSSVLQYIKANENEFSPNELYKERQHKFLTKFGKSYNDDSTLTKINHMHASAISGNELSEDENRGKVDGDIHDYECNDVHDHEIDYDYDDDDEDDTYVEGEQEESDGIFYKDDDEDLMLPESPRLPPREIDPGKLYGLYDFSGPDPLHCTLTRDEPVYLINDQDNYWWLIKKLSKDERKEVCRSRKENNTFDNEDPFVDYEYGKIGFVPAECLETYGERLARLNCFKNEELERGSKENLNETSADGEYHTPRAKGECRTMNFSQESIPITGLVRCNTRTNKSVTFEDLGILDLYEDDDDNGDNEENGFCRHYLNISHDELQTLPVPQNDEDKTSEVLSDVYPSEMPLFVNKNNDKGVSKKSITPQEPEEELGTNENNPIIIEVNDDDDDDVIFRNPYSEFTKPPSLHLGQPDNLSIGSYSPDTPPSAQQSTFPDREPHGKEPLEGTNSSIKRSFVLDSLNSYTSGSQETSLNDQDSYNEQANFLQGFETSRSNSSVRYDDESVEVYDLDEYEAHVHDKAPTDKFSDAKKDDDDDGNDDFYYDDFYYFNGNENDDDSEVDVTFTPFTSTNSLSNGLTLSNSELTEKRKSKPVHDMFVPVLGKFDLLAEKLSRLDDLI